MKHTTFCLFVKVYTTQKRTQSKQKPAASTRMMIWLCVCQPEGSDSPF